MVDYCKIYVFIGGVAGTELRDFWSGCLIRVNENREVSWAQASQNSLRQIKIYNL